MKKTKKQIILKDIAKSWSKYLLNNETFYLPVLGPIHISPKNIEKLLYAVLKNSTSIKFLRYDKNKRWFSKKQESIILSYIKFNDKEIFIPVVDSYKNVCKIFFYSNNFPDDNTMRKAKSIYNILKSKYKVKGFYFYSHQKPKIETKFILHNIYLKNIRSKNLAKLDERIKYYNKLPKEIKKTFYKLGKDTELNNFYFLWKYFILKNKKISPIVCAVLKNGIVGAIGPLDIIKDAEGTLFLLPPHFGVLEKSRKQGIGEKLWQEAMHFAFLKGARYTLVQNTPSSSAAKFYEKQGLTIANNIYSFYSRS
jgi:ribosomal protein S18 acetylase RimI-like enzyme